MQPLAREAITQIHSPTIPPIRESSRLIVEMCIPIAPGADLA